LIGSFALVLCARVPERLVALFVAGCVNGARGREVVGVGEDGADGAETEFVGDGAGEDDCAD
jgi:hypothetical protein